MKKIWLGICGLATFGLILTEYLDPLHEKRLLSFIPSKLSIDAAKQITFHLPDPYQSIEALLRQKENGLSEQVINKVMTTLKCSETYGVEHNHILTIIDYSLPSSMKRFWVFDLNALKLLFHTYVSHGIKSGALLSQYFSNKYNSRASSLGVYKTEQAYYGREGLSLRLDGIDKNFNDNASNRAVVMHGGWYVNEPFIKRYGRAGRSWGCPALPLTMYRDIINTIKDNALFVVYYPSEDWFKQSKFLTCTQPTQNPSKSVTLPLNPINEDKNREYVLFANWSHKNSKLEESAPILAMSANYYEQLFQTRPPLLRMLRRQIDHEEYIALSASEFKKLVDLNQQAALEHIHFVLPTIQLSHGYAETVMKIVKLGRIKQVDMTPSNLGPEHASYVVHLEKETLHLISTNRFIRWLGL